ncbi:nicotinamide-nucleotide amidohydrolase family protein [Lactobacillus sp. YT155]|uniref:CinA family protein n=1 Tax=Lactobacillus sp. YT155 TaxID=3060955 RepID=UPI00265E5FF8|nr:nicotinamide-nucleotide amidohydrolase family protein [Lactobacillus sp. YT155]MDO1605138.1 nicotinamide-nucleotide amidohydrolase family protein [Lactobacillus sp. YT155]
MTFNINLDNIEAVPTIDDQIYKEVIFFTVNKLIESKQTITAAESLTAGKFLSAIADVSGASAILEGGFVTYANSAKEKLLGIDEKVVEEFGVVSKQVAEQMASKSRTKMGNDIGVGLTGVAGPDKLENHSAGTVFIGISTATNTQSYKFLLSGDRELVRKKAVIAAMLLVQKEALQN